MERIRTVILRPYTSQPKGMAPVFTLTLWDTYKTDNLGKSILRYRLVSNQHGVIFEGEDFACSPMHAIDSDDCVKSLLGFLTLKPGDTDDEYFENYTQKQLDFCAHHAEALECEVMHRFGED